MLILVTDRFIEIAEETIDDSMHSWMVYHKKTIHDINLFFRRIRTENDALYFSH